MSTLIATLTHAATGSVRKNGIPAPIATAVLYPPTAKNIAFPNGT